MAQRKGELASATYRLKLGAVARKEQIIVLI